MIVLFDLWIGPEQLRQIWVGEDMGEMTMNRYSIFPKPLELNPHHQVLFVSYLGHSLGRVLTLCRDSLYCSSLLDWLIILGGSWKTITRIQLLFLIYWSAYIYSSENFFTQQIYIFHKISFFVNALNSVVNALDSVVNVEVMSYFILFFRPCFRCFLYFIKSYQSSSFHSNTLPLYHHNGIHISFFLLGNILFPAVDIPIFFQNMIWTSSQFVLSYLSIYPYRQM